VVYFGGFFAKLGQFAGFSLHIINNGGSVSEAALGGAGDIILYFLRGFFFILFAERISEAAMGRTGVWGHNMINKNRQKESCTTLTRIFSKNWNFSL
jgi:hypothetical protein